MSVHDRFLAVVRRAFARPVTDFHPAPARPVKRARGTSAKTEAENPSFHAQGSEG